MSFEMLDTWRRELPQGSLTVHLQWRREEDSSPSTFDGLYRRETLLYSMVTQEVDSWTMSTSVEIDWSRYLLDRDLEAEDDEENLRGFRELLPLLGTFYEKLLTQVQQDGLVLPLTASSGPGPGRPARSYPLLNGRDIPQAEDILALLLSSNQPRKPVDGVDFQRWLSNPPRAASALEAYYALTSPDAAFLNPWETIFYSTNHRVLQKIVAKSVLDQEENHSFLHRLAALASIIPLPRGQGMQLLGIPLEDLEVTLGAWDPNALLTPAAATMLAHVRGTTSWLKRDALKTMPLTKASFRQFLETLTLRELLVLLDQGDFKRSMSTELGIAHARNVLGEPSAKPTAPQLVRLHADIAAFILGDNDYAEAAHLWELVANLMDAPATYACARALVDERQATQGTLGEGEIYSFLGTYAHHWCARRGERDAVLLELVSALGAPQAQRLVLEVAAVRQPLTAAQWHSYILRRDGDFQGLPASMWARLV